MLKACLVKTFSRIFLFVPSIFFCIYRYWAVRRTSRVVYMKLARHFHTYSFPGFPLAHQARTILNESKYFVERDFFVYSNGFILPAYSHCRLKIALESFVSRGSDAFRLEDTTCSTYTQNSQTNTLLTYLRVSRRDRKYVLFCSLNKTRIQSLPERVGWLVSLVKLVTRFFLLAFVFWLKELSY